MNTFHEAVLDGVARIPDSDLCSTCQKNRATRIHGTTCADCLAKMIAEPITAAESVKAEEHTGLDLLGELSRVREALRITEEERKDRALENADLRAENEELRERVAQLEAAAVTLARDLVQVGGFGSALVASRAA